MSRTIWVGAVAYDPKVVTIWEGMRRYFHEEARIPVEVVLFQSYETQVGALLAAPGDPAPRIDIAWNTNLAYLQADARSARRCRAIAMRDTDLGWTTKIVAVSGGPVTALAALRDRTLALGSRDSGHAAILPVHFLESEGLVEGREYRTLRFDSDVGKHGDTGTSEAEVIRAVLEGGAQRAPGARRRAHRDLDLAALQPLHVHGSARSRPVIGAAVRRSPVRHELRQPEPPCRARRRG